jgi:hypothetical protein
VEQSLLSVTDYVGVCFANQKKMFDQSSVPKEARLGSKRGVLGCGKYVFNAETERVD